MSVLPTAENPLRPPDNDELLRLFCSSHRIELSRDRRALLENIGKAFSRLPYENFSKVVSLGDETCAPRARRSPRQVIEQNMELGTGGTCFSLTATLIHLARCAGFEAMPILADRHYGPDTHCAMLVYIGGKPHLLDPGFLITRPVEIPRNEPVEIDNGFNRVLLVPAGTDKLKLYTVTTAGPRLRLEFKLSGADEQTFCRAWDASFDWPMMRYPVLSRVVGSRQYYLQKNRLLVREAGKAQSNKISIERLPEVTQEIFGLDRRLAVRALERMGGDAKSNG